ncbi:hypothetical protein J6590_040490 [Homalodisca vitripennis]|nr:hypothetical protein J6590_040490 [Homalodisca vitripennis]
MNCVTCYTVAWGQSAGCRADCNQLYQGPDRNPVVAAPVFSVHGSSGPDLTPADLTYHCPRSFPAYF